MEFNTSCTTPAPRPASYSPSAPYYFSQPYTSFLPTPSHSYAVVDTSKLLGALFSNLESGTQRTSLDQFVDKKKRFAARRMQEIDRVRPSMSSGPFHGLPSSPLGLGISLTGFALSDLKFSGQGLITSVP